MMLFLLFIIGAALSVGPWVLNQYGYLSFGATAVVSGIGCFVLACVAVAAISTRLYRKASASLSFVRTGMGGVKVIQGGGAIVVPVIHQVIPVSMETMRL